MNRKGFAPIIIIIIVAAVLAVAGGSYFVLTKPQPPVTHQDIVPPAGEGSVVYDAGRWKTYVAEGFTFKYPPDWKVSIVSYRSPAEEVEGKPAQPVGLVLASASTKDPYITTDSISFGGHQEGNCLQPYYTKCDSKSVFWTRSKNPEILRIFDLVVGSIERVQDTSSWQTYRNEQYGFEFRYPVDWNVKTGASPDILAFFRVSELEPVLMEVRVVFDGSQEEVGKIANQVQCKAFSQGAPCDPILIKEVKEVQGRNVEGYWREDEARTTVYFPLSKKDKHLEMILVGVENKEILFREIVATFQLL